MQVRTYAKKIALLFLQLSFWRNCIQGPCHSEGAQGASDEIASAPWLQVPDYSLKQSDNLGSPSRLLLEVFLPGGTLQKGCARGAGGFGSILDAQTCCILDHRLMHV